MISDRDTSRVIDELAAEAQLTRDEAERVLSVLHLNKLIENATSVQQTLHDDVASRALNLDESTRQELLHASSPAGLTVANLRIGVRPPGPFHVHVRV